MTREELINFLLHNGFNYEYGVDSFDVFNYNYDDGTFLTITLPRVRECAGDISFIEDGDEHSKLIYSSKWPEDAITNDFDAQWQEFYNYLT